jgi:hypothetical protein
MIAVTPWCSEGKAKHPHSIHFERQKNKTKGNPSKRRHVANILMINESEAAEFLPSLRNKGLAKRDLAV